MSQTSTSHHLTINYGNGSCQKKGPSDQGPSVARESIVGPPGSLLFTALESSPSRPGRESARQGRQNSRATC